MHMSLKIGDTVKVWPRPGILVQSHAGIFGRFVDASGAELQWTTWLHERVQDGSLLLTDPRPSYRDHLTPAEPAKPAKKGE